MDIKDIFLEIINEAKDGVILIDELDYNIGFNTRIGEEEFFSSSNDLLLNIRNLDTIIDKLTKYISEEEKINRKSMKYIDSKRSYYKLLIMYLFVNASPGDYENFESQIDRYISFLSDDTLSKLNNGIAFNNSKILEDELLLVGNSKQSVLMETPNKLEVSIVNKKDNNLSFKLPEISYGICEENGKKVCYVYSILNKEKIDKKEEETLLKYKKRISRLLYKLNKNIEDLEEKINDENITDVSVSSVLSLYIFLSLIKDKVDIVKGVPYLPNRYYSRDKVLELTETEEKRKKLEERNNNIQNNSTNKFIRTFRRVNKYIKNMSIDLYPYEVDGYITCSFNKSKEEKIENELLDSIGIKK